MAQRIKSDKPVVFHIKDWSDADKIVRNVGILQQQIIEAEASAKEEIDRIKAGLAKKVKPWQDNIKLNVSSIEAFAESHKTDFKKQRSRKLNFGVIGWRKSTSVSIKKTTLELIKKAFSTAKQKVYIRTKETVDKDALAKLTDEQMASVGARRKEKDVFFVEPSSTQSADYE